MIYITGDTHGEVSRFTDIHKQYGLTETDMLIVAGDFGCIFGHTMKDEEKLDALSSLPYMILFIDGNHECFPKIYSYPEERWNGGRIHRIRTNVLHLMRGQVYQLGTTSVFTMGGGYSIDKMYRIPGRSWWEEELPNRKEYDEARENLLNYGNRVDVIVSHAAPDSMMEHFIYTGEISHRYMQEMQLNLFLEEVKTKVQHKNYYFGHMHLDRQFNKKQTALYYDVYCLESGQKAICKYSCE